LTKRVGEFFLRQ